MKPRATYRAFFARKAAITVTTSFANSSTYTGLGPTEYAERILDAYSTHILHARSDPGPVSRRAGKKFFIEASWSEDEEGIPRKHIRQHYDWRGPETAVIQQYES